MPTTSSRRPLPGSRRRRRLPAGAWLGLVAVLVAPVVAPPVARAGSGPTDLAAAIDHLPIVTAGADRTSTLRDPSGLEDLYAAAVRGLVVPDGDAGLVEDMLAIVAEDPEGVARQAPGADATLRVAMRALGVEQANADRISDMAIALWLVGAVSALDSTDDGDWYRQHAAIRLLQAGSAAFPDHRAILLNLAFLRATTPGWGLSGEEEARSLVERDPADITARALLASIQSRRGDLADGAERALATLAPLLADPATAPLGEALAGDAQLAVASIRRAIAPAQARRAAGLALAAYDRAAALTADPAIQAGRARALELLGDLRGAADAMRAAASASRSLDFDLDLARLQHRRNDIPGMRATADDAISRVLAGWDPLLAEVRFVVEPSFVAERVPADRGFLGWSIGSAADHVPLTPLEEHFEGGPGVVVIDTVELEFPGVDHDLAVSLAPRTAWRLALTGAILDGDATAAERLDAAWDAGVPWGASWVDYVDAARLTSGEIRSMDDLSDPLDALAIADQAYARAGRFAEGAEICRRAGVPACAAANALRGGEPAALEASRLALEPPAGGFEAPISDVRLLAAAAAEAAGDPASAERYLQQVAGASDAGPLRVRAAIRLGDLRLDAGDAPAAAAWYELALASIAADGLATIDDYHLDGGLALEHRGLEQVARNNHGVALLRTLQPNEDTAPPCGDAAVRPRCEAALEDFAAAAASDPANGVYRMNHGWAARLLDLPDAARASLEAAVALDPSLYPASNDLGVLLARKGDVEGARAAFEAALAADPGYDLASWNLGILALRQPPAGLLEAQGRLATAIREDPSLRAAPLDFRTDERTRRFGFEAPLGASEGLALGRTFSLGALVLAGVGSIAALAQLQAALVGHGIQTATGGARGWLDREGRRARWRARHRELRRRLPPSARGLLPWLGIVLILAIVSAWQAAVASPATTAAAIILTLVATAVALVTHLAGHWIALRLLRGRLIPSSSMPGALVALLFLPVQAASGPFLAERLRLPGGGHVGAWRFHLAGPLANALVGVVAYLVFLAEPAPALRLVAQVQLAAIAYTLLPIRPLDGWAIKREHPRLLVAIGFLLVAAGSAFALGLL